MSKLNLALETKPELSVEDFNALYAEMTRQAQEDLEVIKGLKNGETYNPKVELDYWNTEHMESDDLQGLDPEDMIESINEFREACKEHEDKVGYYVYQKSDLSGDYEDSYAELEAFYFECQWKVPIEEVSEEAVNAQFKHAVRYWLVPEGTENWDVQHVDCKLLSLFKDGKIDWATLRTLVYSNCDL